MSGSAIGYAVAAAVFIALGSALQHQAGGGHGHRGGIGLLWRLARSRRWMTGLAAAGADAGRVTDGSGMAAGLLTLAGLLAAAGAAIRRTLPRHPASAPAPASRDIRDPHHSGHP